MHLKTLRKHLATFLAIALSVTLMTACSKSKDDNGGSSYPKTVSIEYKVVSSTGLKAAEITWTNETGGNSDLDNAALPFSKKFDRKVEKYNIIYLRALSGVGGSLTLEIYVDGKKVQSKTATGSGVFTDMIGYTFE